MRRSELLKKTDEELIRLWSNRLRKMKWSYGEYNGRPVVRIWSSKGSPCKRVFRSYGMFTFLADMCMVFIKLGPIPKSVLEETYWHFRKKPHFRPMEVERYVQKIYQEKSKINKK